MFAGLFWASEVYWAFVKVAYERELDFFYGDTKYLAQNNQLIREDIKSLSKQLDKIQSQCSQIIYQNTFQGYLKRQRDENY